MCISEPTIATIPNAAVRLCARVLVQRFRWVRHLLCGECGMSCVIDGVVTCRYRIVAGDTCTGGITHQTVPTKCVAPPLPPQHDSTLGVVSVPCKSVFTMCCCFTRIKILGLLLAIPSLVVGLLVSIRYSKMYAINSIDKQVYSRYTQHEE